MPQGQTPDVQQQQYLVPVLDVTKGGAAAAAAARKETCCPFCATPVLLVLL